MPEWLKAIWYVVFGAVSGLVVCLVIVGIVLLIIAGFENHWLYGAAGISVVVGAVIGFIVWLNS